MRRQEFLLNLTLLVIIGALVYLIYNARQMPSGLDDLAVSPAKTSTTAHKHDKGVKHKDAGTTETIFADNTTTDTKNSTETLGIDETAVVVAEGSPRGGNFGKINIFRALLTPAPTPTPTPTPPPPTPDIGKALGSWKLLSVYQGKAMMEDVEKSKGNEEGAIWEMPVDGTKQVDVGNGIMKTATLKKINNSNPYNPDVVFGLEDTTSEREINLDTEPSGGSAAPKKK